MIQVAFYRRSVRSFVEAGARTFVALVLVGICVGDASAQDVASAATDSARTLRVFVDCDDCDHTHMRRNLRFVDYVRDPQLADVHVLVTDRRTASGGESFRLSFIGKGAFAGEEHRLTYTSNQSDTDDLERRGLLRTLSMGLMPFVAATPAAEDVRIVHESNGENRTAVPQDDPWDSWIFRVGISGEMNAEERQNEMELGASARAERITDLWKFESEVEYDYDRERFEDDGRTITSILREGEISASNVRSLSPRWSAGAFAEAFSTTFTNIEYALRSSAAIEYNIFPWDESDRRQFVLAYHAGVRSFDYFEETLFGETAETLTYQALRMEVEYVQPWGEFEAELEGLHYFHDPSKYRIVFQLDTGIRVTRGLSLYLELQAESIHDQLYLPRGDASLEEVLLRRRQLATTYELGAEFGIRFTFGSIYNNVVNPRL